MENWKNLSIRNHCVIFSSNIKITLVELSVSSFCHCWLVSSIYLTDVKSFNFLNVSVHSHEPCKRHSQVISQRTFLSTLIFKIINKLGILSIFSCQNFFEFKYWCVDLDSSMLFENLNNSIDDFSSNSHLIRKVIFCSFRCLNLEFPFFFFLHHSLNKYLLEISFI